MNFKLDEECSPVGVHGQNQLFHLRLLDIRMASLSVACIILSSQFHFNVRSCCCRADITCSAMVMSVKNDVTILHIPNPQF